MAYKTVDLRGKIPGSPAANQGVQKKTDGGIQHHNGDPSGYTGVASGGRSPADVYAADARYHMSIDWGTPAEPAYANGIQYHYGVWEDTVYILRNPDAILWHCASWPENASRTAVNVPISANERATPRTLQTLREFWDDEMRRQGRRDRAVKGHREVSSTSCPGSLMADFVLPYRAGKVAPVTIPKPGATRNIGEIRGGPIHPRDKVLAWAKGRGAAKPALDMIPPIYKYAAQRNIGADVLSVQMCHETAFGKYGGASKPYNGAGIKKGSVTGDTPSDFEVPKTADEGARMLVNHWCAVLQLPAIGTPHGRYAVAKAVYAKKPPITRIDQVGNGNWATDPNYAEKLIAYLTEIGKGTAPTKPMAGKADKAIAYMKRLITPPTPYGFWRGGWPPPAHPPNPEWMFFPNGLPNAEDEVPDATCAGMINLGNAAAGVSYRNGTLGYAADLVNKRRYVPGMAIKKGEVLVNDNVSGPGDADRSHIAMYIGGGLVISCDHRLGGLSPGVNIHGLAESHRMFGYEFVGEVPGLGIA